MIELNWDFRRLTRTASSEQWLIWGENGRVGTFDVHFTSVSVGTLVLEVDLTETEQDALISELDERIASGGPREDFLFSIVRGSDMGFFSDSTPDGHAELRPVTQRDLENEINGIKRIVGRGQDARAQLNEMVACEFFRLLGYSAALAGEELDRKKIDVVAEDDDEVIFCQVKLGGIRHATITALLDYVGAIENSKKKTVAVIADAFPIQIEQIRRACERERGLRFWIIHKSQVLAALPRFRRTLERE